VAVAAYLYRRHNVRVRYESHRRPRFTVTTAPVDTPAPEAVRWTSGSGSGWPSLRWCCSSPWWSSRRWCAA